MQGSNGYKLKNDSTTVAIRTPTVTEKDIKPRHFLQGTTAPAATTFGESIEVAASASAYKIADAENKAFIAADAVKEAERLSKMVEDADSMLLFAKEILNRCINESPFFIYYIIRLFL